MKKISFLLSPSTDLSSFDTLVLPVFDDGSSLPEAADWQLAGLVNDLVEQKDFSPKPGKTLMLLEQTAIKRICLVGMGEAEKLSEKSYIEICNALSKALETSAATHVLNTINQVYPAKNNAAWAIYQHALNLQANFYEYTHPSRGEFPQKEIALEAMTFLANKDVLNLQAMEQAQATAFGMALTRDLANMPANFCTPAFLADTAIQLSETYGFENRILEREEMTEMGMGSFMSVAEGTPTPPKMICLSYQGTDANKAPIALVGKGVTFDTGGISLKPGAAMDEMKYDMGGAATVLGVFESLGQLKPKVNVVGIIPATENMPAGNATKPGDVVTSLSGQTIEVLNTDAEGRLILCDALTYVQQTYQPKKIIDMATLTGACIIALGHQISAVLGNSQALVDELLHASRVTYDRFWQMPLSDEYDEQLKSNFADMANIGGRPAGTITAAQFLARFTKEVDWAHLDIAGTAWTSGANKGATGRPVPAVIEFLMNQEHKASL